ncbi:MAG: HAMP domain-containing sensor histidine kinase [Acidocella sp.]|nr:HAMP domain-containing sensor histidine kinase [Acidocella sp.]
MNKPRTRASLFRMASFRLAVLGTLFSTIAAVIVFALLYKATKLAAYEELSPIVASDRADILSDAASDHTTVAAEIALTTKAGAGHTYYALANAQGRILVQTMPMPAAPLTWQSLTPLQDPAMSPGVERIDGTGVRLADGSVLFIGEDATVFATLNRRIAFIFAIVFGAMIGLGLLASILIASYSLKRVSAISEASAAIMTGDLSRRIEAYGIDDELDVLTEDLNRMLEMIERLVENARQVTNDIAHDLRSPLMRLHGRLVHITRLAAAQDSTLLAQELNEALAQSDLIISLFAALLRLSEIEAGALYGGFVTTDLSALVRSIGDEFVLVAEDCGQSLTVVVADAVSIHGDIALLTQMIVNIVENAIRHCPSGTVMTLSLVKAETGTVYLEMADSGPGIPEAERERVFQRFVRLDRSRQTPGHGLGLPLVCAIATLHGGGVKLFDNAPGLRVRIDLPAPSQLLAG